MSFRGEVQWTTDLRLKLKNQKPVADMSFARPIQWYHSHPDLIRPDGTLKRKITNVVVFLGLEDPQALIVM